MATGRVTPMLRLTTTHQQRRSLALLLCNVALLLSGSNFIAFSHALLLPKPSSSSILLYHSSTSFLGTAVRDRVPTTCQHQYGSGSCFLTMRKQKASDRRTRRRQRGEDTLQADRPQFVSTNLVAVTTTTTTTPASSTTSTPTFTVSPMHGATWQHKRFLTAAAVTDNNNNNKANGGGRGRSRKRTALYHTLAHYQNHFLQQLTAEYQSEEDEVLGRIKASLEDPLGLEQAGYCLLDMVAERRGNLFQDEVYRLTKARDATTTTTTTTNTGSSITTTTRRPLLPAHHKFSNSDVIVLTQQPRGSGDFFTSQSLPITDTAVTAEARILSTGPTYIDVALSGGAFAAAFGTGGGSTTTRDGNSSSSNNKKYDADDAPQPGSGRGSGGAYRDLRLRVDRFVSNVPYQRMVTALSQLTAIPENKREATKSMAGSISISSNSNSTKVTAPEISMDEFFKELIVSTYAFTDPNSAAFHDPNVCNIEELSHKLAKPPMASSPKLARQVLKHIQDNRGGVFRPFNAPQLAAIEAALSRRMCMIHGPPGSGKTAVAAAIGVGFVHQCRSLAKQQQQQQTTAKVLACAFSNVGADNLAEALIQLGLKVVRVGKSSAVAESLWSYTLDAAIDRDPVAQKALQNAAKATAQLSKLNDNSNKRSNRFSLSDRTIREAATAAVKASIEASNIAATVALRDADVIVATSIGAADPKLLAACGISSGIDEVTTLAMEKTRQQASVAGERTDAPDGLPPLSLPFVILDEACQSVEPASLIPIVASNSCRALVMLGDPCQLPPTVRSREADSLGVSLMERLSATLPHPSIIPSVDACVKDSMYLDSLPMKQAVSLMRARSAGPQQQSYRKAFGGSLLLSIQYRMHPSIAALPSAIFYGGLLATPDFMRYVRSFPRALEQSMPCGTPDLCVRLIHVGGQDNERQGTPSKFTNTVYSSSTASASSLLEQQTTYWNEAEAQRVLLLLKDIVRTGPDPNANSIGIITPYNGQVQLIKSMIARDVELRDMLQKRPLSIEVKSVDGYQGRERDVIIFSAVRSNRQERIGFLHDWRRMNVALTRAKSGLLVVGDFDTLSAANKHWAALTKWASGVRCVVDDCEHPENEASQ